MFLNIQQTKIISMVVKYVIVLSLYPHLMFSQHNLCFAQTAVDTMKEYISLPAKRFVHLVHKYVHNRQMKTIEGK